MAKHYSWVLILMLATSSCKKDRTDSDSDDPVDCSGYNESECRERTECKAINGRILTDTGCPQRGFQVCVESPGDKACLDTTQWLESPDGVCIDFPDSCIPRGWTLCTQDVVRPCPTW
jgi:hypothetical protein